MLMPTDFELMLDPNYLSKIAGGVPLPVYVRYTSRASLIRSALGENFTSKGPFTGFAR